MSNFAPYQSLDFSFAKLFETLSGTWATGDLEDARELVAHAEYGEALENLIAIAARTGRRFSADQSSLVTQMGGRMGLDVAALMKPAPAPRDRAAA